MLRETAKQRLGDRKELEWCVSARERGPRLEAEEAKDGPQVLSSVTGARLLNNLCEEGWRLSAWTMPGD